MEYVNTQSHTCSIHNSNITFLNFWWIIRPVVSSVTFKLNNVVMLLTHWLLAVTSLGLSSTSQTSTLLTKIGIIYTQLLASSILNFCRTKRSLPKIGIIYTQLLQEEKIFAQIRVIGLMEPEICKKMLKKLSEKLRAKFPVATPGCSMIRFVRLDDSFLEVF